MNIWITGAGGFIATHLARGLADSGYRVTGMSSRPNREIPPALPYNRVYELSLAPVSIPKPVLFKNCDVLFHLAYDSAPGRMLRNIEGTRRLRQVAATAGVKRQVFISSHSARKDATSIYGRSKFIIEQEFLAAGHCVVRPGLVVGPGGLFARIAKGLARLPVVFLPARGQAPAPVIDIDDLVEIILILLRQNHTGAWNLFLKEDPTQRAFVHAVLRAMHRRVPVIGIPTQALVPLFRGLRKNGFNISNFGERLETMYLNMVRKIHISDLTRLSVHPSELAAMTRKACKLLQSDLLI